MIFFTLSVTLTVNPTYKDKPMLDFIDRYRLDMMNTRPLPRTVKGIDKLINPSKYSPYFNLYKITHGSEPGHYLIIYPDKDKPNHNKIVNCEGLKDSCSVLFRLIRKDNPKMMDFTDEIRNETVKKFPKQHREKIRSILSVLYEIDFEFHFNCKFLLGTEIDKHYFGFEANSFAYIIHEGSNLDYYLSYNGDFYNHGDNDVYKFLEQYFDVEPNTVWSTSLDLKD